MSEYTTYYHEFCCSNAWADEDPEHCGCGGRGWFSSQVDTWHRCPVHGQGLPHPEEPSDDDVASDWAAARALLVFLAALAGEAEGEPEAAAAPIGDGDHVPF